VVFDVTKGIRCKIKVFRTFRKVMIIEFASLDLGTMFRVVKEIISKVLYLVFFDRGIEGIIIRDPRLQYFSIII
jgi:hypothetical protein